jgi:hypothetical protein
MALFLVSGEYAATSSKVLLPRRLLEPPGELVKALLLEILLIVELLQNVKTGTIPHNLESAPRNQPNQDTK